jgi:hypothetical protein
MKFGAPLKDKPFGDSFGDGDYLRTFKEGPTLCRFPFPLLSSGWIGYYEHYDKPNQRSVPCNRTEDGDTSECRACNSDDKNFRYAARKVATNIQLVDKEDMVLPFKMSQRLYEQIERKAERDNGDVTKRDYLLTRTGKDQSTVFDVDREDVYEVDLKALQDKASDVQEILKSMYEEYWEKYGASRSAKAASVSEKGTSAEEDIPPTEPADLDLVIDEASLRAMNEDEIDKIISAAGLKDIDPDWSRSKKVDVLVDRLGE